MRQVAKRYPLYEGMLRSLTPVELNSLAPTGTVSQLSPGSLCRGFSLCVVVWLSLSRKGCRILLAAVSDGQLQGPMLATDLPRPFPRLGLFYAAASAARFHFRTNPGSFAIFRNPLGFVASHSSINRRNSAASTQPLNEPLGQSDVMKKIASLHGLVLDNIFCLCVSLPSS